MKRRDFIKCATGVAIGTMMPIIASGSGKSVFGEKTLASTNLDKTNLVRLIDIIKRDVFAIMEQYRFEFNDALTRTRMRSETENYLMYLKNQRIDLDEFVVICDESNNSSQVIDENSIVLNVMFKQSKTVEYYNLRFGMG